MPYVKDDDSKAAKKIAEIAERMQDTEAELDRWLAAAGTPASAGELAQREREGKASKHWQVLTNKAFAPPLATAA
jgi:hypothetical protein